MVVSGLSRLLSTAQRVGLCQGDAAAIDTIRSALDGEGVVHGGWLYVLYNSKSHYIGKTAILREDGLPGAAARICEHIRAFLRPHIHEGDKARYRILRGDGLRALRFIPVFQCDSAESLAASEYVAINL